MTGYLLDTNIVSEYTRVQPPDARLRSWMDQQEEETLHLSVVTLGEIRKGTTLLPAGKKRERLERWLHDELLVRFGSRVLPVSEPIAEMWGMMSAEAQMRGFALPILDGLIAATARQHRLVMVTRNVRDFRLWGIEVLNPWETQ